MTTRKLSSRIIGCVMALGVTLAMASCTTPDDPISPSPTATESTTDLPTTTQPPSSEELKDIITTGEFGEAPTVTVASPWTIQSTEWKVLVQGSGAEVGQGGLILVNYQGVNARTGEVFDDSWENEAAVTFSLGGVIPGFQKGLTGQKVGSRVLIAMPGADGYDANGGKEDAGIEIGDTLIFVVDILRTQLFGPSGTPVNVNDPKLPAVSGPVDAPIITIPKNVDPPTSLVVQPLIKGSEDVVEEGDAVYIDFAEYIWDTGEMVRKTYGFYPMAGSLSTLIQGWQDAILGQAMGTRLLLVVPPELAYPEGHPKIGVPKGSTMVYVLDILYATSSS